MACKLLFLLTRISCVIIVIFSVVNLESFADDNARSQRNINDPQPFQLNKLNMMWEKAKKASVRHFSIWRGSTGVSGLTIGLATLPQDGSRNLQWSETGMEDPQEDHRGSALLLCVAGVHCWEISIYRVIL